jgi:hypothetical protein
MPVRKLSLAGRLTVRLPQEFVLIFNNCLLGQKARVQGNLQVVQEDQNRQGMIR